jgi:hypothetical protein
MLVKVVLNVGKCLLFELKIIVSYIGYDVGDLSYGVDNVNQASFPDNTYLSVQNQDAVQQYVCITIG